MRLVGVWQAWKIIKFSSIAGFLEQLLYVAPSACHLITISAEFNRNSTTQNKYVDLTLEISVNSTVS